MAEILNSTEVFFQAFEPKVANRFILRAGDSPLDAFMVKSIASPSFEDEEIILHHINTYRKIRGKRTWNDISMTLYDPITPSAAQAVMEWARLSYESVTGRAGYSDFYKKDIGLKVLGPVGDVVSEWSIKGAFVKSANFGEYDWSSSDAISIELTIGMDYCILEY